MTWLSWEGEPPAITTEQLRPMFWLKSYLLCTGEGGGVGAIYRFPVIIQSVSLQSNPPIYVCI